MKFFFSFLFACICFAGFSQSGIVTIEGYAPAYVGMEVGIYQIDDYFSMKESKIAGTTVKNDSLFKVSFQIDETRKLIVRSNQNSGFLYVQANGSYKIYFPESDKYLASKASGNQVELSLYELDSLDINYKILKFNRYLDHNIAQIFPLRQKASVFGPKMDSLRQVIDKHFMSDSSSYFRTYVRYTVASLDNVQYGGNRNRYEKYEFYLKQFPVYYQNDMYMNYVSSFYENMMPRFSMETNNRVYLGLLKSSPTLIMRALENEVTLSNLRLREMIMLKSLSESYYSEDLPHTNILAVLDSVSKHSLFEANGIIAANLKKRLTEVVPGGEAPDFALKSGEEMLTLSNFRNKHLYLSFMDPENIISRNELELLLALYEKYKNEIEFVTVVKSRENQSEQEKELIARIPWKVAYISADNSIYSNYQVNSYPYYVLIDPFSYVIAAPALGPAPNGLYQTIEKTFFELQKRIRKERSIDKH